MILRTKDGTKVAELDRCPDCGHAYVTHVSVGCAKALNGQPYCPCPTQVYDPMTESRRIRDLANDSILSPKPSERLEEPPTLA